MKKSSWSIGPATLVAAAFIGPGTVTTCTLAGVNFGHALLWALLFSVLATIILQEMTARLGIITQQGLGETLRQEFNTPLSRSIMIILVMSAIFIGNGAYEGGNISGAALGLETLFSAPLFDMPFNPWSIIIGTLAFSLLATSRYKIIEGVLIGLVVVMSLTFLATFIVIKPNLGSVFSGLLIPSLPDGSTLTVIALIGTTVVPYNLFLHAAAAKSHWQNPSDLPAARKDIYISLSLGGLISLAIVSTAAAAFFSKQIAVNSAADLARQLEPLLGAWSHSFMGVGLLAAGVSSAITAPLAAAYAVCGIMGWDNQLKDMRFRLVWGSILVVGIALSSSGLKPLSIIWFAQVANGLMLPLLAIFLLKVMNNATLLGEHKNSTRQNALGFVVIAVTLLLSGRSLMSAFGLL